MNNFNLKEATEILERTSTVLISLLSGLSDKWIYNNEGGESWNPFDIVGHMIHGEKKDWIQRAKIILEYGEEKPFEPFDRFAQFKDSEDKTLNDLLEEFAKLRKENIDVLNKLNLDENDFNKTGIHPDFGKVTLKQLLSTWVVHDLSHIRQISRVMAKQYKNGIGPWEKYLPVINE
ncbi:MAG: DinB family protein [Ignavibacteriaceae bacterium]